MSRGNNITYRNVAQVAAPNNAAANQLIRAGLAGQSDTGVFGGIAEAIDKYSAYREESDTEALQTELRGLSDNAARNDFMTNLSPEQLAFADQGDLALAADRLETRDIAKVKANQETQLFDQTFKQNAELFPGKKTLQDHQIDAAVANIQATQAGTAGKVEDTRQSKEKFPTELEFSKLNNQEKSQTIKNRTFDEARAAERHGWASDKFDQAYEAAEFAMETAKTAEDRKDADQVMKTIIFGHTNTAFGNSQVLFNQKLEEYTANKQIRDLTREESILTSEGKILNLNEKKQFKTSIKDQRTQLANKDLTDDQKIDLLNRFEEANFVAGMPKELQATLNSKKNGLIERFEKDLQNPVNLRKQLLANSGANSIDDIDPNRGFSAQLRVDMTNELADKYQAKFKNMDRDVAVKKAQKSLMQDKELMLMFKGTADTLGFSTSLADLNIQQMYEDAKLTGEQANKVNQNPFGEISTRVFSRLGLDPKNDDDREDIKNFSKSITSTMSKVRQALNFNNVGETRQRQINAGIFKLFENTNYDKDNNWFWFGPFNDLVLAQGDGETDIRKDNMNVILSAISDYMPDTATGKKAGKLSGKGTSNKGKPDKPDTSSNANIGAKGLFSTSQNTKASPNTKNILDKLSQNNPSNSNVDTTEFSPFEIQALKAEEERRKFQNSSNSFKNLNNKLF